MHLIHFQHLELLQDSLGNLLSGRFTTDIRGQIPALHENSIDRSVDLGCGLDVAERREEEGGRSDRGDGVGDSFSF